MGTCSLRYHLSQINPFGNSTVLLLPQQLHDIYRLSVLTLRWLVLKSSWPPCRGIPSTCSITHVTCGAGVTASLSLCCRLLAGTYSSSSSQALVSAADIIGCVDGLLLESKVLTRRFPVRYRGRCWFCRSRGQRSMVVAGWLGHDQRSGAGVRMDDLTVAIDDRRPKFVPLRPDLPVRAPSGAGFLPPRLRGLTRLATYD